MERQTNKQTHTVMKQNRGNQRGHKKSVTVLHQSERCHYSEFDEQEQE